MSNPQANDIHTALQDSARRSRTRQFMSLFRIEDPLPKEISDPRELTAVFDYYKVIPYAGNSRNSGHKLLYLYIMLANLAPTQGAAIKKLVTFAAGSRARIIRQLDSEFDLGEPTEDISLADTQAYFLAIKQYVSFEGGIRSFARRIVNQYKTTGNIWIEMLVSNVQGQIRVKLKVHRATDLLYRIPEKADEMRTVLYSPAWTDEYYLSRFRPEAMLLFPNFTENAGVMRTLFHFKNDNGQNNWYGRPDSEESIGAQYNEMQNWVHLTREAAGGFTGRFIGEIEEDDPDSAPAFDDESARKAGFDGFLDRFRKNFTNEGEDPSSFLFFTRPAGASPGVFTTLRPYTTENFYETTGAMHMATILKSHGLSKRFMGEDVSAGFASNAYLEDYLLLNEPTINELHETCIGALNNVLNEVWNIVGQTEFQKYAIRFDPPIAKIIEDYKEGIKTAQSQGDTPLVKLPVN